MINILYIARPDMLEYQSDSLLHGLLSRGDCNVDFLTMSPRQFIANRLKEIDDPFWYLFNDANESLLRSQYGRGFTLYAKLQPLSKKIRTPTVWLNLLGQKYDLVIYGAIRWNATLFPLVSKLYGGKLVVIDGDDRPDLPKLPCAFKGYSFKRELVGDSSSWLPISFAIPSNLIVREVPSKTQLYAGVIPGSPGDHASYRHNTEESYYADYQRSLYGRTKKKGGWDCLRHYEILMNGCIPHFEALEDCPSKTMTTFPKDSVIKLLKHSDISSSTLYSDDILHLLDWTRRLCTTSALATYVLGNSVH